MKVFQFGTDCKEWVVAKDEAGARAYYEVLVGENDEVVKELTEEEMKKVMLTDLELEAPENDPDAEAPTNSIYDLLKDSEKSEAYSIGSTEY